MKVYSSFPNKMNFIRSGVDVDSVLKRYALLYEHVIFNRHGCPIGDVFPDLASFIACSFSNQNDITLGLKLGKNKRFKEIFIDMWDMFEDIEKLHSESRSYISEDISQRISKFSWFRNAVDREMGLHNHHKEYKAAGIVGGDISSDIAFNLMLADRVDDFNMSLAPVIGETFKSAHNIDNELNLFSTNLVLPDFESLTWDQVLELRQDKYIKSFRDKVFSNVGTGVHPDEKLHNDLEADLWYLAEQCKPSIGKRLIEIFLSNVALPSPINPFSYFYGAKSLVQDAANMDKSWVFVIQNMRKLS
ncbi:hypothetical protein JKP31_21100 [Vibrio vulnificus]|uniref:hypothetical protein n=1 Tax=Vibrio vulnificus TaxID=672 RepID=UPI001CDD4CDF|nr:hypothetical protein [Vibrio vulnificus]MCA3903773.1 hypothetical protein [Vibrio vulnificus]